MKVHTNTLAIRLSVLFVSSLCFSSMASAQSVEQRLKALEAKVSSLESSKAVLTQQLISAQADISLLKYKTQFMSVLGTTTYFRGTNVQIVKDNGNYWTPNGLGNLIIGYNNIRSDGKPTVRSGSHNLVLGNENSYPGTMGIVGGFRNSLDSLYSAILSGRDNIISPPLTKQPAFSVIATGELGRIRGEFSSIVTGYHNVVDAFRSGIFAGVDNKVEGATEDAVILNGELNRAEGYFTSLLTGRENRVRGLGSLLGTGWGRTHGSNAVDTWYTFATDF